MMEVSLIDLVDNLKVDLELILDVKAFDAQRAMDLEKSVRALGGDNESAHGHAHGHSHDDAHDHGAQAVSKAAETPDRGVARAHSSKIGTVAVTEDGPLDERKLNLWLGGLLWESDSGMSPYTCRCRWTMPCGAGRGAPCGRLRACFSASDGPAMCSCAACLHMLSLAGTCHMLVWHIACYPWLDFAILVSGIR